MRALVISGGGSKGAFAGGVAQYLLEVPHTYDIFVGTSTGSLLIPHLALNKVDKIREVFTSIDQGSIFSSCPFVIKKEIYGIRQIGINHFNVILNLFKGKKTFGESHNLKKLIVEVFTEEEFNELKESSIDIVVTVSNLSLNQIEYKSINDFNYPDFCDWIWISCNYTPFMSLAKKGGCEYADGGFGSIVPIEEAINRGATEVDVIVLETEVTHYNRMPSKNLFSLLTNMFAFMVDRIENQNIRIGKFSAGHNDTILNFYYTPTVLTTNSLIFDKEKMTQWWESGFQYAMEKNIELSEIKGPDD
jgi:NTE family protein